MAVDTSMFQQEGAVSSAPSAFYAKDKTGAVIEVEVARDSHRPPPTGFYQLRLRAISAPFEMDGQFGKSRNVRAVFQVVSGPYAKQTFTQLLGIARADGDVWRSNITNKTAVGQLIVAIRGREIAQGEPINLLDYLNGQFAAMVNQVTKAGPNGVEVYGNVVKDTWQPTSTGDGAATSPPPAPMTTTAPVANGHNPFLDDDDE